MANNSVLRQILEQGHKLVQNTNSRVLIALDENSLEDIAHIARLFPTSAIITNRWDIFSSCRGLSLKCTFNDFNFHDIDQNPEDKRDFDLSIYRVSKERPVSHHILNQLFQRTKAKGHIIIGGKKNEGIKTYFDKCKKVFSSQGGLKKNKDVYLADFSHFSISQTVLDDKNYKARQTINIPYIANKNVIFNCVTKPGIYGWNKIDHGSEFLIDTLLQQKKISPCKNILDLGCGIGYLSLQAMQYLIALKFPLPNVVLATDNNAAAIDCCRENLNRLAIEEIDMQIVADDCAASTHQRFELILCNPPFHQGFDTSRDLTQKFIAATKRLLASNGSAYFVVNSFIALESIAEKNTLICTRLDNNKQFKVIELKHG